MTREFILYKNELPQYETRIAISGYKKPKKKPKKRSAYKRRDMRATE